ncbi:PIP5K8, partial [Symbiodinium necroappetens]
LQDGDPHGVGKMVWPDGRTYHGNWVFGQPHGQGVMSSIAPVEAEYETWVYSGQFQDGLRHGVGRCEWPAVGAWYEGDWVLDAEHGLGELGAGATESQDGDPHVWCMYNGEKQENVATSRVFPGPEDELMVVVLQ